jgi:regulator of nucleoside diphosphate kinase
MNLLAPDRQLTWLDHARLFNLVRGPRAQPAPAGTAHAKDLLDLAELVDPQRIAPTVVTMRSRVRLVRPGGQALEATLAYPAEAQVDEGRISVFSPLGLSLLGARVGETVEWAGPGGEAHRAELAQILYQPEAAGDFTR